MRLSFIKEVVNKLRLASEEHNQFANVLIDEALLKIPIPKGVSDADKSMLVDQRIIYMRKIGTLEISKHKLLISELLGNITGSQTSDDSSL